MPKKSSDSSWWKFGESVADFLKFIPDGLYDFFENYFRLEVYGLENVPKDGKGLLVANHSDALGMDAFMLIKCLNQYGIHPTTMAHNSWFLNDFMNSVMRRYNMFPADLKEGLTKLKDGNLVLIFPEGEHGNFKVSSDMYKLVDFNPGFVPLAIMQEAMVIPTVIMGAEETHFNLGTTSIFKGVIGADIPIPLNVIPFPAKWKIKFLKPISFSKYSKKDIKNARFVKEINQNIRYRIQHEIEVELGKPTIYKT